MTTFELGNRVTVVNAPGRPSMQEQELPHLLRAEGTIHDMREVGGNIRIVVDFDNGTRYWFYEDELKLVNGVQNLTADVPVYEAAADVAAYLEHDAFTSHAAEEAPLHWDAPVQPELALLDAPEPDYLPQRLPLSTPVMLRNGVSAVVSGNNPNDVNRLRVSWFDTHFWVVRHLWTDRVCVEVLPTALETEVASAV